jgi:hypothetical protein
MKMTRIATACRCSSDRVIVEFFAPLHRGSWFRSCVAVAALVESISISLHASFFLYIPYLTLLSSFYNLQEKYDSFRYLLEQWGFLRISRGRDRGAYFHKLFLLGKRELCATASKTEMVDAMPKFLSASEEPDLYTPDEQAAVTEAPNEPVAVDEEAAEKSSPSDTKSPEIIENISLKDSKPEGGTDEDAKSRDRTSKTKAKPTNKAGKSDPPPRREKARSKPSKKRKAQEDQSATEPIEREPDAPSPRLSRTQRLLKIPLCRYYLPPLNFSPCPSYNHYAINPFDFASYEGSNEKISKD